MKKTSKRIFGLVIALALAVGMTMAAFADYTITLPDADGVAKADGSVTYDIYQIFTGKYDKDATNKETLSDVHWGSSTAKSGQAATDAEVKAIAKLADGEADTARTIFSNYVTGSAFKSAQSPKAVVTVPDGYYLIKENIVNPADGQEASLYAVKIVGNVVVTRKASTTSSDKKLDDKNDSEPDNTTLNTLLDTSSDYDIGDEVPYHVTATISQKVGQYKKYHITLEDILEANKFDAITLDKTKITIGGASVADTDDYTVTETWDAEPTKAGFKVTFTFEPKNGKTLGSLSGKVIKIDFKAKLGKGAAIGSEGNKNTLKVRYSNNPNNTDDTDEGTTPDKVVITFTYKVVVNKVDEENKPLPKAGFTLYKVSKTDAEAAIPADNNKDAATRNAYWATKAIGTWTDGAGDEKTSFSFNGIDDGYYVLCETTTPAGYNTMDPKVFKVSATHGGTDGLTLETLTGEKVSGEITLNSDVTAGSLTATIQNKKGSTLPATGGMGTTIFYVIGGILVLAAAIILISRRRVQQ